MEGIILFREKHHDKDFLIIKHSHSRRRYFQLYAFRNYKFCTSSEINWLIAIPIHCFTSYTYITGHLSGDVNCQFVAYTYVVGVIEFNIGINLITTETFRLIINGASQIENEIEA